MFRQSHMNQSRLPLRTTAVYSQGDKQHQSLATPAPYILLPDICEPHTQICTQKHLTSPCHTLPIICINTFFKVAICFPLPDICVCHFVMRGFIMSGARMSIEKQAINLNQSKRDYEVNYIYSFSG